MFQSNLELKISNSRSWNLVHCLEVCSPPLDTVKRCIDHSAGTVTLPLCHNHWLIHKHFFLFVKYSWPQCIHQHQFEFVYQMKIYSDGALMTAWNIVVISFKTVFHLLPPPLYCAHHFIPNTSMIIPVCPVLHHRCFKTWSPFWRPTPAMPHHHLFIWSPNFAVRIAVSKGFLVMCNKAHCRRGCGSPDDSMSFQVMAPLPGFTRIPLAASHFWVNSCHSEPYSSQSRESRPHSSHKPVKVTGMPWSPWLCCHVIIWSPLMVSGYSPGRLLLPLIRFLLITHSCIFVFHTLTFSSDTTVVMYL